MSVIGKIKNGVVELPPGTKLPEGAEVKIEALLTAAEDPLVATIEKLARPRPHLPRDFALNFNREILEIREKGLGQSLKVEEQTRSHAGR